MSPAARRVTVVTGTRADYGLLRPTIAALAADDRFEVDLMVCAMHLSERFGATGRIVEEDGFPIRARVETETDDDRPGALGRRLGQAMGGFTAALGDDPPDVLLVLGDRYEMLAAALAAAGLGVAVVHLHGGELSEGSLDDAMRHAITKLSHLHLVAARPYGERVCQLGEQPDRVRVVGAAGLEAIRTLEPLGRDDLAASLSLDGLGSPLVAATFHPASLEPEAAGAEAEEVAAALAELADGGATVVVTLPNDDPGNAPVRRRMLALAEGAAGVHAFTSLGQQRYLSLLAHADVMVGNSSSGLLEAPAFELPVVDVGDRQRGRLAPPNVVHSPTERQAILDAARRALDPSFRRSLAGMANPYGTGHVSEQALEAIAALPLGPDLRRKRFLDLPDGPWRAQLPLGGQPA